MWELLFPDFASASYNTVEGVSKTRINGFSLPARDEAHHTSAKGLHVTGKVERWNGTAWVGLALHWVQLYYRPKGTTTWRKDFVEETGTSGNFRMANAGVHMGTSRTSAGSYINGVVSDVRNGQTFSSLRGLRLRLYYRARGTKTWHADKTAKVKANGLFHFFDTRGDGYRFKVVLPAQGPFLSSTSRIL